MHDDVKNDRRSQHGNTHFPMANRRGKRRSDKGLDRTPVTALPGVGPSYELRLAKIGIRTVQDVLFHLPRRYQDRTRVMPIGGLTPGEQVAIEGVVDLAEIHLGRRRSLLVRLSDGTGVLTLRFFHFSRAQKSGFSAGTRVRCFSEVREGPTGLEMIHPEYSQLEAGALLEVDTSLTPMYPSTEGVSQQAWRGITDKALLMLGERPEGMPEWLPPEVLQRFALRDLAQSIHFLHRPPADTAPEDLESGRHPAQRRLAFEELLAHQLSLRTLRGRHRRIPAPAMKTLGALQAQLVDRLPFSLTGAQRRVWREIGEDLRDGQPMMRLVQGDVGSGKTVVAALAALQALEAGFQVALMAPTELLAEQHLHSLRGWLQPLGMDPLWLTGRHKGRSRDAALAALASGKAQIVVGTHALFQEDVAFNALGLVVIDEQHRFGVHQRLALREKGRHHGRVPHQLIMTATPIPRTLAMTAYADLDISVIDELPPGRTPVSTVAIPDSRRPEVIERIRVACGDGRQAYWVCTLIEESEALQCQAAEDTATLLTQSLADLEVGIVHGRLKPAEKESVMDRFKQGAIDLLVATTVIEVGVDVPNASLMVIENPERLGLAQLHQLRGRVGRGDTQSHCVLMFHAPLSAQARERLAIMRATNDGFQIARKDLELRGPGEVLGTRQTGDLQLRIADVLRDEPMLADAQKAADLILRQYSECTDPLVRRWLGERREYAGV